MMTTAVVVRMLVVAMVVVAVGGIAAGAQVGDDRGIGGMGEIVAGLKDVLRKLEQLEEPLQSGRTSTTEQSEHPDGEAPEREKGRDHVELASYKLADGALSDPFSHWTVRAYGKEYSFDFDGSILQYELTDRAYNDHFEWVVPAGFASVPQEEFEQWLQSRDWGAYNLADNNCWVFVRTCLRYLGVQFPAKALDRWVAAELSSPVVGIFADVLEFARKSTDGAELDPDEVFDELSTRWTTRLEQVTSSVQDACKPSELSPRGEVLENASTACMLVHLATTLHRVL